MSENRFRFLPRYEFCLLYLFFSNNRTNIIVTYQPYSTSSIPKSYGKIDG